VQLLNTIDKSTFDSLAYCLEANLIWPVWDSCCEIENHKRCSKSLFIRLVVCLCLMYFSLLKMTTQKYVVLESDCSFSTTVTNCVSLSVSTPKSTDSAYSKVLVEYLWHLHDLWQVAEFIFQALNYRTMVA
jgi:hypothetical protein